MPCTLGQSQGTNNSLSQGTNFSCIKQSMVIIFYYKNPVIFIKISVYGCS